MNYVWGSTHYMKEVLVEFKSISLDLKYPLTMKEAMAYNLGLLIHLFELQPREQRR